MTSPERSSSSDHQTRRVVGFRARGLLTPSTDWLETCIFPGKTGDDSRRQDRTRDRLIRPLNQEIFIPVAPETGGRLLFSAWSAVSPQGGMVETLWFYSKCIPRTAPTTPPSRHNIRADRT